MKKLLEILSVMEEATTTRKREALRADTLWLPKQWLRPPGNALLIVPSKFRIWKTNSCWLLRRPQKRDWQLSALPVSQQRCFSAYVGNGSTESNVPVCFNKIEGTVLQVGKEDRNESCSFVVRPSRNRKIFLSYCCS